jgi:hypothetical protein
MDFRQSFQGAHNRRNPFEDRIPDRLRFIAGHYVLDEANNTIRRRSYINCTTWKVSAKKK